METVLSLIERRNFSVTELRAITDDNGLRHIVGYAAVFNSLSEDLGWFREKIQPGAFSESIGKDDIRALWNHNSDYILGRNKSKTLSLKEDDRGLRIDILPSDAQWVKDLMLSMDRGDVDQMSFGFRTIIDQWERTEEKEEIRTLIKVQLFDVSPVTFSAYPDTTVGLRSLEEYRKKNPPDNNSGGQDNPGGGNCSSITLLTEEDGIYRQIIMCG